MPVENKMRSVVSSNEAATTSKTTSVAAAKLTILLASVNVYIISLNEFIHCIAQNSGGVNLWQIDRLRVLARKMLTNLP